MASPASIAAPLAATNDTPAREWSRRSRGRWSWQVRPEWAHLLDAAEAPDYLNLESDARASLVKSNDGRQVWRLELGAHLLYVKVCRPPRRWASLRRLFFGCDASRERQVADYGLRHRVDTVVPLAVATAPLHGREPISILITQGLSRAVPLNEFWQRLDSITPAHRRARNQVIDASARLIANAHQNGFEHSDLHAGNVLVEPVNAAGWRALFVDLLSVRIGRPVSDAGVVRNLAQFNQWFRLHAPVTDRIRFLKRYLLWRDRFQADSAFGRRIGHDCRALLPLLDQAADGHANALYGKRDRRALRSGRYFAKISMRDGWRAHLFLEAKHAVEGSPASLARLTTDQWKQWLQRPEDWSAGIDRAYVIKDSPTALVYRTRLPAGDGANIDVVCKRSIPRNWIKRLALRVRPSRPMLTWRLANALLNRQIPTARPLALAERRRHGQVLDAFILTEYIENAHDLDALLTVQLRELSPGAAAVLKHRLSEELVVVLRRLHERGFTHRDLKAPNLIVQWDAVSSDPPRVLLVDLDGIRQVRRRDPAAELRALARLNVSLDHCRRVTLADRARFLKRYLARPGHPEPDWRPVWKQIQKLSGRKRSQKAAG